MMWLLPSFWFPCSKKQRERAAKADSKISKTDNSVLSVLIDSSEILTKYGENKYKKTNSRVASSSMCFFSLLPAAFHFCDTTRVNYGEMQGSSWSFESVEEIL